MSSVPSISITYIGDLDKRAVRPISFHLRPNQINDATKKSIYGRYLAIPAYEARDGCTIDTLGFRAAVWILRDTVAMISLHPIRTEYSHQ